MAISKKLEIIYHDGKPNGIRLVRRTLSTMTTYIIPRSLLSEAKSIQGINRPGIYYLIHESDDNRIAQIYVGQTRNGVGRLDDHNRTKDFWNKAILFLADSKTFTLDMISGLEKYAIQKATESKRYKVENAVVPRYEIDEYDLAAVEEIYEEIRFILAAQGYQMDNASESVAENNVLHTTRNGIATRGIYDGENFVILERSEIAKNPNASCSRTILSQRQTALENGDITEENGKLYLTKNVSFSSPSSAAAFVLGASANGWTEWKDHDGKTLDDLFRKT